MHGYSVDELAEDCSGCVTAPSWLGPLIILAFAGLMLAAPRITTWIDAQFDRTIFERTPEQKRWNLAFARWVGPVGAGVAVVSYLCWLLGGKS